MIVEQLNTQMDANEVFPQYLGCIVTDGYEGKHLHAKPYLGHRIGIPDSGEVTFTFTINELHNVEEFVNWWKHRVQYGVVPFIVTLTFMGRYASYLMHSNSDLVETYTGKDSRTFAFQCTIVRQANTTPPVITIIGNNPLDIVGGGTFTDPGATATDSMGNDISDRITTNSDVNTGAVGTYHITYQVIDEDGNMATPVTRIVNVTSIADTTPPVITLNGSNPVVLTEGTPYVEPGYTAIDNVDGDITSNVTVGGDTVDENTPATYSITYDVSDAAGNSAQTQTRTVIVNAVVHDTTPPVITLNGGDMTVIVGDTFTDPGYAATDDTDGDITSNVVVTGSVDTNTVGTYTLRYNVHDAAGNAAIEKTRNVSVEQISTGTVEFDTAGAHTWTVPAGVTSINVCAIGGGGGGGRYSSTLSSNASAGGGHAGQMTSQSLTVSPGDVISITVGAGGAAAASESSNGSAGGATTVTGGITLNGGAGGSFSQNTTDADFNGRGASAPANCMGSFKHGTRYISAGVPYSNGGEAGFANGGAGGSAGTRGSGGGGGGKGKLPKAGGDGFVRISW